jgi:hypothetical protein
MIGVEAIDAAEVPTALVAVTVKVYVEPLVRPETTHVVPDELQIAPPGFAVTVYCVMAAPFSFEANHETVAC